MAPRGIVRRPGAPERGGAPTRHRLPGVLLAVAIVAAVGWGGGALAVAAAVPAPQAEGAEVDCAVPAAETDGRSGAADRADRPALVIAARSGGTPAATPVAATPEALDPEEVLAAELSATARALAACLSEGEAETVVELATDGYLGQLYGGGVPLPREDYLALAPDLDQVPTVVRSLRDADADGDEATAEVVSVVGGQLLRGRWTFVRDEDRDRDENPWRVDAEAPLAIEPPADATVLDVALEEYAIGAVAADGDGAVVDEVAGPDLLLRGRNAGAEDHEILVLRLRSGATTADLLVEPGPGLPRGVTYVGQATVPAGERAEVVLVDLAPGDYAIVCLFPTPRGTPHLALGMEAGFTVR